MVCVSDLKNNFTARENDTGKGIDIWYEVSERNCIIFSLGEEQSTTQKLICLKLDKQTETRLWKTFYATFTSIQKFLVLLSFRETFSSLQYLMSKETEMLNWFH